jgi:hypothetical protein
MEKSQHTTLNPDLLARLHDACRPSFCSSDFAMRAQGESDYLAQPHSDKASTLGESIRYKQHDA